MRSNRRAAFPARSPPVFSRFARPHLPQFSAGSLTRSHLPSLPTGILTRSLRPHPAKLPQVLLRHRHRRPLRQTHAPSRQRPCQAAAFYPVSPQSIPLYVSAKLHFYGPPPLYLLTVVRKIELCRTAYLSCQLLPLIVNQAHCTKYMFDFCLIHSFPSYPHTFSPFLSPPEVFDFTANLSYAPSYPHYPQFSSLFSVFTPVF